MTEILQSIPSVPLTELRESKTNTRKIFDIAAMDDLTASIKEKGIITPLLVRPVNSHYEIVAGARRFRAAKVLGLKDVPAIIRELSDEDAWAIAVIDNLQREGVDAFDECEGYRDLMKRSGLTIESVAARVGKSQAYIAKRVKLNDLIPEARKAYAKGAIQLEHALLICRLSVDQQVKALEMCEDKYGDGMIPASDLAQQIRDEFMLELQGAAFPKDDATLLPKAGSCLSCPKRSGFDQELFADLAKKDTCMDPPCFHKKLAAFLSSQKRKIAGESGGVKPIEISGEDFYSGRHLPARNKWTEASKGEKGAVPAVIVEGKGIGRTLMVKVKVEKSTGPELTPEKASERERKEKIEREIRERVDTAVREATAKVVPEKLTAIEDLQLLQEAIGTYVGPDTLKLLGLTGKYSRRNPKAAHIVRLILWDAYDQAYGNEKTAARWGVDVKGIEKRILAEAKPPKADPVKKSGKKANPKGKKK
jgi:ParB family chromosome partitioning protein